MERSRTLVAVEFDGARARPIDWHVRQRMDFVVDRVMRAYRGHPEETVRKVLSEQLRCVGMVPNQREIQKYAAVIARLPRP